MAYPVYYVEESDTLPVFFDTFDGGTGASITMTGLAVTDIEIYKDGGTTQRASDAGYTLLDTDGIDFDSLTGIHGFSIDLSDNTDSGFYAVGSWYHVVVSTITVDSQTVSFIACAFRIVSATRGMAGTALPAAAADAAGGLIISDAGGLDADAQAASVAAIETDTSTTLQGELDGIQADTEDIQSRLPAALVGGRIDATVDGTGMEAAAAAVIVDAWETQSQADPTGFHVNVLEVGGTSQTANDNGADINTVVSAIGTPTDLGGGATLANNNADIAGATFSTSTDSNEAIRNRGDAAWTTGAGGSSPLEVASGTIGATGNDTTHLHLDGLGYVDDAINGLLMRVYDDSASLYYHTWITDFANSGDLATVETLPFTPEASTDTYVVLAIHRDINVAYIEGGDPSDTIRDAVVDDATRIDASALNTASTAVGSDGSGLTEAGGDGDHLTEAGGDGDHLTEAGGDGDHLSEAGGTGDQLSAVPWNSNWDAEVQSEVNDALVAQKLDHLVAVADSDDVADNSVMAKIAASDGDWSGFSASTDSLEGLRDHIGDGTNLTEAGGDGDHLTEAGGDGDHLTEAGGTGDHLSAIPEVDADVVKISGDATAADNMEAAFDGTGYAALFENGTLTESYATDGSAATIAQMLYMIWSALGEFSISGTTITAKKLDGSTTAMTFTLDDDTSPTSRTRAS